MELPEVLKQNLVSQLNPRRRKRSAALTPWQGEYGEQPDYGFNYDDAAGPGPDYDDQEPMPPPESFLPSFLQPGARVPQSEIPPIEFNEKGQPLKPKLSEDRTIALQQKLAHARALEDYDPKNNNSKIKSALITAGRGALAGFSAGGLGGAIFGGAGGAIQGAVDPSADEKYARRRALSRAQGEIDTDLKRRKLDTDYDSAIVENRLKSEQALNLARLPERERGRQWESMRKDLVETYNRLPTFDPKTNPEFAAALKEFGIVAPAKDRAKKTQLFVDQKSGEVKVTTIDQNTGAAAAAPVMEGEKPLVTTTTPMMSKELQEDRQEFQAGQQENRQTFQSGQQQGRQTYGQDIFNQRKQQQQQETQRKLVGSINAVISSLGRIDSQIAAIKSKGTPEPKSDDAKQLFGLEKNRNALLQRGETRAAELNALGGDYESGVGERGFPYIKLKPGRTGTTQSGTGKYSEADVRARARSAGKDENIAVQKARAAGLIP